MQLLAPELKEIQRRYKGDRVKVQQATADFYKERGVNPASGCLPLVLQFVLLIPMYTVFRDGLQNFDPNAMLDGVRGPADHPAVLASPARQRRGPGRSRASTRSVLRDRPRASRASLFTTPIIGIGISILAIVSALLQLVQSRMTLPPAGAASDDQNTRIQRQTMLFVPLISIFYGGFLPAGLFMYWIVSTIFSIVQQYLIVGWGGMFPHLRLVPVLRPGPHPALPGRRSGARSNEASTDLGAHRHRRASRPGGLDRPTPRTQRPYGPPRETTLT